MEHVFLMGYVTLNMKYTFVSWARSLFPPCRQNRNCLWNIYTKKLYDDNFCFEKYYPHWKLLTLIRPLHLTTLAFVNGKNNGFTTNDWQEKHISVYLVNFACTSCLGQNFSKCNKPSVFVKVGDDSKIVQINSFFISADRP